MVGWATADHLRTDLVADALTAACRKRRPTRPLIFHSDRNCQYTSQQFAALAGQLGVRLSVGRTGQCWDNALAESFFATIKRELLDSISWPSRAAARTAIFDFTEGWYNLHRLHSSQYRVAQTAASLVDQRKVDRRRIRGGLCTGTMCADLASSRAIRRGRGVRAMNLPPRGHQ